jgi:hypothetical protein
MIISAIIAWKINKNINPSEHYPYKYGYFLSIFTIIEAVLFLIWAFSVTFDNHYSSAGEKFIYSVFIIIITSLLFVVSILNAKKYKIGAIVVSIVTGNFIICIFYYSRRWHEFKSFKYLFQNRNNDENNKVNKNILENDEKTNEFIRYFDNDKLFEDFIWAVNKIGNPINEVITINDIPIKIHPMVIQYSKFLENGRHIEKEIKNDILKIVEINLKNYIILFSNVTGNKKFDYIVEDIEKIENDNKEKEEEKRQNQIKIKEKYKNIEDFFNDKTIIEEAKKLGRIYGKGFYISHLKTKAKELGLGEIELNEKEIEL